ncbi:MAG TPA: protein nirF [Rhodospirillales bacterium]|nr:protein nirF [Rhodospirillales bacterium]
MRRLLPVLLSVLLLAAPAAAELRGTGDLGIVVERASGSVLIVETSGRRVLARVEGLGDLSHASAVFSRDQRYAYIFGRDGGLTKLDLLEARVAARVVQAGNSIGGAISADGDLVAVANYEPGGVRVFDAENLALLADIPSVYTDNGARSKVVGIEDLGGRRFAFSLYDGGQIWLADLADPTAPRVIRFADIGRQPYDALVTPDGRYYIAGLFGEDGLVSLDLWQREPRPRRILDGYGRGEQPLPVYKMPHLEGWSQAGDLLFLPAVGRHELLVVDRRRDFAEIGRIPVHGQPVFAVARPDGRQVWVNFAHPRNDTVQVIDVPSMRVVATFSPGKAILHLEFTPRGEQVWISARDSDEVVVYDTESLAELARIPARKPSGIFFTARANRIGF